MNEKDAKNQKPVRDFEGLGSILDGLTGSLFGEMGLAANNPTVSSRDIEQVPSKPITGEQGRTPKAGLARAAASIVEQPDKAERNYLAREMVQCTLPHRDPGDVPVWIRRNGNYALGLQPGIDLKTGKSYGLPYGELPRLLLLWIITQAILKQDPVIECDDTLNDFLRNIGCQPEVRGGKRGEAARARDQMERLFNCRISFQYSEGDAEAGFEARRNMEVASESVLWWNFKQPEQGGLFKSRIKLGDAFFKAITAAPVPVDLRAVIALKQNLRQSSFAIDVYIWTTYRIFRMQESGQKQIRIPLSHIKEQFGGEYKRLDNFKAAFVEALSHVQQVFPSFSHVFDKGDFVLCDSKNGRAVLARKKASTRTRLERPHQEISPKARIWFIENYTSQGWSLEAALKDFTKWRSDNPFAARSLDALFRSFVRDHWAKH
jgi:hypothetical protein